MASGSDVIRVLSWNINGLKAKLQKKERKTALLNIFDQYDIVLLQETHIGKMKDGNAYKNRKIITKVSDKYDLVELEDQTRKRKKKKEEKEEKEETMYMTFFSSSSKGVAIIVNKPHTLLSSFSAGGDYAWVHVQIDGQEYTFVSVYYHKDYPDLNCNLMRKIFKSFSTEELDASKCMLVIGGDFNTTLNPELDLITENPDHHAARRKSLNEFLSANNLSDVWRQENTEARQYTYRSSAPQSRLDYVFMLKEDNEEDADYVESCEILNEIDLSNQVKSDHFPVSLTLNYTSDIQQLREE